MDLKNLSPVKYYIKNTLQGHIHSHCDSAVFNSESANSQRTKKRVSDVQFCASKTNSCAVN